MRYNMYFADLTKTNNFGFFMVGWLDSGKYYNQGLFNPVLLKKLEQIMDLTPIQTKGFHLCPFCKNATSSREAFVLSAEKVYQIPQMIIHYIKVHNYFPPSEFIEALKYTPLPKTEEHKHLINKLCPID
jgi:hypothetical protein